MFKPTDIDEIPTCQRCGSACGGPALTIKKFKVLTGMKSKS